MRLINYMNRQLDQDHNPFIQIIDLQNQEMMLVLLNLKSLIKILKRKKLTLEWLYILMFHKFCQITQLLNILNHQRIQVLNTHRTILKIQENGSFMKLTLMPSKNQLLIMYISEELKQLQEKHIKNKKTFQKSSILIQKEKIIENQKLGNIT